MEYLQMTSNLLLYPYDFNVQWFWIEVINLAAVDDSGNGLLGCDAV